MLVSYPDTVSRIVYREQGIDFARRAWKSPGEDNLCLYTDPGLTLTRFT